MKNKSKYIILAINCILIVVIGLLLFKYNRVILLQTEILQRSFNQTITQYLLAIKDNQLSISINLLLISYLYGIIHAIGPGHGKFIVTSYLVAQPVYYKRSLLIVIASSLVQALVAIGIVTLFIYILHLSKTYIMLSEQFLTQLSYLMLMICGFYICFRVFRSYLKSNKKSCHSHCSCCSHTHNVDAEVIKDANNLKQQLLIIFSIGIRPCSGSLLILFFAQAIGIYYWGIIVVLMIAAGIASTLIIIATIIYIYKNALIKIFTNNKIEYFVGNVMNSLSLVVGILFIIISIVLLYTYKAPPLSLF